MKASHVIKRVLRYIGSAALMVTLGLGSFVEAYADSGESAGLPLLWMLMPIFVMFLLIVVINEECYVPLLLKRGDYGLYFIAIVATFFMLDCICITVQDSVRMSLGIHPLLHDGLTVWMGVQIFIIALSLSLLFFALGICRLYGLMKGEIVRERHVSERLDEYKRIVAARLDNVGILSALDDITASLRVSPQRARRRINELTAHLRRELYELPHPPVYDESLAAGGWRGESSAVMADLLVSARYRPVRHMLLLMILLAMAAGSLFESPGMADFSMSSLMRCGAFFIFLLILVYADVRLVLPHFIRSGTISGYLMSVAGGLILLTVGITWMALRMRSVEIAEGGMMDLVILLATVFGSAVWFTMLLGGCGTLLMLQHLIRSMRLTTILRAETLRQEYAYLRKQVNPHFIFNILHDISILADGWPGEAADFLSGLRSLIGYQLNNLNLMVVGLDEELDFVRNYMMLEKMRHRNFSYAIETEAADCGVELPPMLLLPVVENAVKYGVSIENGPGIILNAKTDGGWLEIECLNHYRVLHGNGAGLAGGIGLDNVRRRINLFYEGRGRLDVADEAGCFSVKIRIPGIYPGHTRHKT